MKSEYQKMIAGEPYHPFDPELRALAKQHDKSKLLLMKKSIQ